MGTGEVGILTRLRTIRGDLFARDTGRGACEIGTTLWPGAQ